MEGSLNLTDKIREYKWRTFYKIIFFLIVFIPLAILNNLLGSPRFFTASMCLSAFEFLIIIAFIWWLSKGKQITQEEYKKQKQEQIYETELIKEKARLQAQKEFNQHKKK